GRGEAGPGQPGGLLLQRRRGDGQGGGGPRQGPQGGYRPCDGGLPGRRDEEGDAQGHRASRLGGNERGGDAEGLHALHRRVRHRAHGHGGPDRRQRQGAVDLAPTFGGARGRGRQGDGGGPGQSRHRGRQRGRRLEDGQRRS